MIESQAVNIVIVPDKSVREKASELGRKLSRYENSYTLGNPQCIPHATIYQAKYPTKNFTEIENRLENLSNDFNPFEIKFGTYLNHHGYIWWNSIEHDYLKKLHSRVLDELNPLRKDSASGETPLLNNIKPDFSGYATGEKFTAEESYNARTFGAIVVGKLFQPHVTLAKLKNENDIDESGLYKLLGNDELTSGINEICIGKMGDYGTVTEILKKFKLGRKQ